MNEQDPLKDKMAEIGARYLARTLSELAQVRELADKYAAGSPTALKELERAVHKIHGSGAMFGFDEMSARARDVEHIAVQLGGGEGPEHLHGVSEHELHGQLASAVTQLELATRTAARAAGIETNG